VETRQNFLDHSQPQQSHYGYDPEQIYVSMQVYIYGDYVNHIHYYYYCEKYSFKSNFSYHNMVTVFKSISKETKTQHNTTQYKTKHNTIQDNTRQYNITQHNTRQYKTIQHNTTQYKTQHNTKHK